MYDNHVGLNSFNHCFWKLRFWAPTVTYGNEKPEGGGLQLNNTFRRSASVRGTPTKLPISFSLLNTWLADSEHELASFLSLLQVSFSWRTPFPLALYNYKLIHFSSHSSDYHGTRNSNYRRNNSNATHCATRAEFLHHSMYEAVSLNAIMTDESQRLYRKASFSEGFL